MNGLDLFSLSGRVALLTGAAGHLGTSMARALCEAGATLYANGRSHERTQALVDALRGAGHDAHPAVFDVRDDQAIGAFVSRLGERHGRLDVLVNNAYLGTSGRLETALRSDYLAAYDLAMGSAASLVTTALGLLENAATLHGSASIVNVASMYGLVSPSFELYTDAAPNPPVYGPAKAALLQWTRYLAAYLGPRHIRANSISPGAFPADGVAVTNPEFVESLARKAPLGRIGRPEDLDGALVFLASSASSFVTGSNVVVDGGWTIA